MVIFLLLSLTSAAFFFCLFTCLTTFQALLEDIRKGKVISSDGVNGTANKKERAKELEGISTLWDISCDMIFIDLKMQILLSIHGFLSIG